MSTANSFPAIPLVYDTKLEVQLSVEALMYRYEFHELQYIRNNNKVAQRFLCANCRELVFLYSMKAKNGDGNDGHKYKFQHPPGKGVDCDWRYDGKSKAEIYAGVREGNRHFEIKCLIAKTLELLPGWKVLDVDNKYVFSPKSNKRTKPDVLAMFDDREVAFEIQLRSEKPDTIRDRQRIHEERGSYLVWVSSDNVDLVSEDYKNSCLDLKQVHKDIAFFNRGNFFIFNEGLSDFSVDKGELYLSAKWYVPTLDTPLIKYGWEEEAVKFSDLNFYGGECFYQDFYELQAACEKRLRLVGQNSAIAALKKYKPHSLDEFLILADHVWPTYNKDKDEQWLKGLYASDFHDRELKLKSLVVGFFRSEEWRDNGERERWDVLAESVCDLDFGISPYFRNFDLSVVEKVLLILGYRLSEWLSIERSSHIVSCHVFYDNKSFKPFNKLCKQAVDLSPYRQQILEANNMQKRLNYDLSEIEQDHSLNRFLKWFTSEPRLSV